MTQEDKQLLKDLCARLPYGVMCDIGLKYPLQLQRIFVDRLDGILLDFYEDGDDYQVYLSEAKPYLRPLSSMTDEEYKEYSKLWDLQDKFPTDADIRFKTDVFDWLNKNMFDYRGLIEKGLALKAPKGMYI